MKKLIQSIFRMLGYTILKDSSNPFTQKDMLLTALLTELSIDLIIDVGANKGQFAQFMREFYKGDIISFEPIADVFDIASKVAHSDPKWHIFKYALSNENTQSEINFYHGEQLGSLYKTSEFSQNWLGKNATVKHTEIVEVRRLESLLDELPFDISDRKILLKSDTQGNDLKVFQGLGCILDNVNVLTSEVSLIPVYEDTPHWLKVINEFEKEGFKVVNLTPVSRKDNAVVEYDCLMVR